MTEQSNAELIAEAITRAELCDADSREAMRDTGHIILRLADALEAADLLAETVGEQRDELSRMHRECHEQRDQLAAVMEKVRLYCENQGDKFRHHAGRILDMLAASPADALREHDAALIEGLADEVNVKRNEPGLVHLDVRYAGYYTGIRSGLESSETLLREKARQRREGQGREG